MSAPPGGGSATPLASLGGVMVGDGHFLYVINNLDGNLVRIATGPSSDSTAVVVVPSTGGTGIAIDATNVYWSAWDPTTSVGSVMMTAK